MQGLLKSMPAPTFPPILPPAVTKKKAGILPALVD
jgi:hypothetical protein